MNNKDTSLLPCLSCRTRIGKPVMQTSTVCHNMLTLPFQFHGNCMWKSLDECLATFIVINYTWNTQKIATVYFHLKPHPVSYLNNEATEMRCFRKLLGISYKDHITNDAIRDTIRQAIGPYDDILTTVKKRKLKWYGHVSRSSGLAKTILQGTVQGGRRRGRQKKRWENNIAEWTGLKFCHAVREAEK